MSKLLAVLVALALPLAASAQCGAGGCGIPPMGVPMYYSPAVITGPPLVTYDTFYVPTAGAVKSAQPKWEWRDDGSGRKSAALYHDGLHVGGFTAEGNYRPRDPRTGEWGPAGKFEGMSKDGPVVNYGVDLDKIHTKNAVGFEASNAEVPNHKDKWRITVRSADPKDLETVKEQVKQAGWQDKVLVAEYPPGSWELAPGLDFNDVHVQKPPRDADGKAPVVHSQAGFSNLVAALRVADPNFKPTDVPDLRESGPLDQVLKFLGSTSPVMGLSWGAVLAVVAGVWMLNNNKKKV